MSDTSKSSSKKQESPTQVSERIKESARQIWLAGLGAYNKAEEDAGKIFDKLVKEGEELETLTRGAVEKRFKAVEGRVEGVKEKTTSTFGKLESVFDERVSAALERLGIPNKKTIDALNKKISTLEKKIKQLESK